ncbi:MAG: serine/threonine protein kinase, partial [Planctomycetes bacterium]|nr:serine/threonine protein kinase [Planctomycetota bacterium]
GKGVTDDGIHYFAMEYVDGEDLSARIKKGVRFSEEAVIDIVIQACQGLESAWKNNIIHRDVNPSNLMLTRNSVVKVADFGIAKSLDSSTIHTKPGSYMGTLHYTSPEQWEGKTLDHRADIYSLGIVLYQLLTSRVPFVGTLSSVIHKHIYESPISPAKINPMLSTEIDAVVLKAIAKKPDDRYQDMAKFKEALEDVKQTLTKKKSGADIKKPIPSTPTQRSVGIWRQRQYYIIATFLILLICGAIIFVASVRRDHNSIPNQAIPQTNYPLPTEEPGTIDNDFETTAETEQNIEELPGGERIANKHYNVNETSSDGFPDSEAVNDTGTNEEAIVFQNKTHPENILEKRIEDKIKLKRALQQTIDWNQGKILNSHFPGLSAPASFNLRNGKIIYGQSRGINVPFRVYESKIFRRAPACVYDFSDKYPVAEILALWELGGRFLLKKDGEILMLGDENASIGLEIDDDVQNIDNPLVLETNENGVKILDVFCEAMGVPSGSLSLALPNEVWKALYQTVDKVAVDNQLKGNISRPGAEIKWRLKTHADSYSIIIQKSDMVEKRVP